MLKNSRKRAVVLALLALFCTAGASYIAVDWKRVGTSLASLANGQGDDKAASKRAVALAMSSSLAVVKTPAIGFMPQDAPPAQPEVALLSPRRHTASVAGGAGAGSFKSAAQDDLFKDGEPAAGASAGKFIVAQNDAPTEHGPDLPGGAGGGGVTFSAPGLSGNGGSGGGSGALPQTPVVSAVPEASPWVMVGLGALLLGTAATRRRPRG